MRGSEPPPARFSGRDPPSFIRDLRSSLASALAEDGPMVSSDADLPSEGRMTITVFSSWNWDTTILHAAKVRVTTVMKGFY